MSWKEYYDYDYDEDREDEEQEQEFKFSSIETETDKATLFNTKKGQCWVPKSICRIEENYVFVPHWFKINYLKEI